MNENEEKQTVPIITCPKCEREWPDISEQAVVFTLIGQCYACFINEVVKIRDDLLKKAKYKIENCPYCNGIPGARETCVPCGSRGWREQAGESLIQLIQ